MIVRPSAWRSATAAATAGVDAAVVLEERDVADEDLVGADDGPDSRVR